MKELKALDYQNQSGVQGATCTSCFSTGGCGKSWDAMGKTLQISCGLPEEERKQLPAVMDGLMSSLSEDGRLKDLVQNTTGYLLEGSGQDISSLFPFDFSEYRHMREIKDIDSYVPKGKPRKNGRKIKLNVDYLTPDEQLSLLRHEDIPLTVAELDDLQKKIKVRQKEAKERIQVLALDILLQVTDILLTQCQEQDGKIETLTKTIGYQDKLIARNDEYVALLKERHKKEVDEATAQAEIIKKENMLYELAVEKGVLEYTNIPETPYKIAKGESKNLIPTLYKITNEHAEDMPWLRVKGDDVIKKVLTARGRPFSKTYWKNLQSEYQNSIVKPSKRYR